MDAPLRQMPEPGTLLWIGPTAHREFAAAYRFCCQQVAQIAVRKNLAEALRRPAGYVQRIVIARPTRQLPRRALREGFSARWGNIPTVALCGSLCDGEGRTGTPWPAGGTLRFSRWSELLPGWLSPCGVQTRPNEPNSSLLVISDRFEMAEPYLHWAGELGLLTGWHRRFLPALHSRFDTVLWDDSAAAPAVAAAWRSRLGTPMVSTHASPRHLHPRHLWLALQPSSEAINEAHAGGVCRVLTKPTRLDAILLGLRGQESLAASGPSGASHN